MSMSDSRKYKAYIELIIATVCITILYLILRDFRLSELLPIDEGKAMDRFIADFIVSGTETDRGFFAVCQYNVQNMVIYLFSRITGNRIIGVNIYYILTFFAISFSSYWLLTKVGVSHAVSVFGAILLSVLPYHTDRGVMQVITSGFFMVPVIMGIRWCHRCSALHPSAGRFLPGSVPGNRWPSAEQMPDNQGCHLPHSR